MTAAGFAKDHDKVSSSIACINQTSGANGFQDQPQSLRHARVVVSFVRACVVMKGRCPSVAVKMGGYIKDGADGAILGRTAHRSACALAWATSSKSMVL